MRPAVWWPLQAAVVIYHGVVGDRCLSLGCLSRVQLVADMKGATIVSLRPGSRLEPGSRLVCVVASVAPVSLMHPDPDPDRTQRPRAYHAPALAVLCVSEAGRGVWALHICLSNLGPQLPRSLVVAGARWFRRW